MGALGMMNSCDRLEAIGRQGSCTGHDEPLQALEGHWQATRAELELALVRLA